MGGSNSDGSFSGSQRRAGGLTPLPTQNEDGPSEQPPSGPHASHVLTENGDNLVHKVEHMDTVINAHASAIAEGIHPPLERQNSALEGLKSLFRSNSQLELAVNSDQMSLSDVRPFAALVKQSSASNGNRTGVPPLTNSHAPLMTSGLSFRLQRKVHPQEEGSFNNRANTKSPSIARESPPPPQVVLPTAIEVIPAISAQAAAAVGPPVPGSRSRTPTPPPLSRTPSATKFPPIDPQTFSSSSFKKRSSITALTEGVSNLTRNASRMFERSQREVLDEKRQAKVAELMEKDVMVLNENQLAKMQLRKANPFTISVDSTFRRWWDLIIAICTAFVIIATPIKVGFNVTSVGVGAVVDVAIDLFYLVEIPLNAFTSYIDETTGEEVKTTAKIRENYLYGYFVVDALSSFPSSLVGSESELLTVCKLLKLARVYKISRSGLFKAIASRVNRTMNPSMMRMMELTFIFFISQHFIACTYFYISLNQEERTTWQPPDETKDQSLINQYVHAVYFAIMVTTANDVNPTTTTEKIFTSVMLFVGIVINASIIGSAANLLSNLDKAEIARKNQMDSINDYMRFKKVPLKLQEKIRRYYEYALNGRITDPTETLFAELPDRLKLSLRLNLHDDFIRKVPLFRVCSNAGVIAIIQCLQQVVVMPQEVIISQGEMATEFYFIKTGRVSLCVRLPMQEIPLGNLGEGSFFGESSLLTGEPQQAEVKSESITELAFLTKEDFVAIVDKFPTLYLAVRRISENRMQTASNVQRMSKMQRRQSHPHIVPMPRKMNLKKVANAMVNKSRLATTVGARVSGGRHTFLSVARLASGGLGGGGAGGGAGGGGASDSALMRLSQRFSSSRRNSASGLFTANYLELISLGQARHLSTLRNLENLNIESARNEPLWN